GIDGYAARSANPSRSRSPAKKHDPKNLPGFLDGTRLGTGFPFGNMRGDTFLLASAARFRFKSRAAAITCVAIKPTEMVMYGNNGVQGWRTAQGVVCVTS